MKNPLAPPDARTHETPAPAVFGPQEVDERALGPFRQGMRLQEITWSWVVFKSLKKFSGGVAGHPLSSKLGTPVERDSWLKEVLSFGEVRSRRNEPRESVDAWWTLDS